jgi:hypothetical protein
MTVKCPCCGCELVWNTRYVQWARAHGNTAEKQLVADEEAWPGGKMTGFVLWMSNRWEEWRFVNNRKHDTILSAEDHRAFDTWLTKWSSEHMEATRA